MSPEPVLEVTARVNTEKLKGVSHVGQCVPMVGTNTKNKDIGVYSNWGLKVEVGDVDTVRELKQIIFNRTGFHPSRQYLRLVTAEEAYTDEDQLDVPHGKDITMYVLTEFECNTFLLGPPRTDEVIHSRRPAYALSASTTSPARAQHHLPHQSLSKPVVNIGTEYCYRL